MCVIIVKLAIESYAEELHSVRKGDGISSNTSGTDCPVPVPGEHALMLSSLVSHQFVYCFLRTQLIKSN